VASFSGSRAIFCMPPREHTQPRNWSLTAREADTAFEVQDFPTLMTRGMSLYAVIARQIVPGILVAGATLSFGDRKTKTCMSALRTEQVGIAPTVISRRSNYRQGCFALPSASLYRNNINSVLSFRGFLPTCQYRRSAFGMGIALVSLSSSCIVCLPYQEACAGVVFPKLENSRGMRTDLTVGPQRRAQVATPQ